MLTQDHLREFVEGLREGVTEVVLHPGYVDDDLRKASAYLEERELIVDLLTSAESKKLLEKGEVSLIGFEDL